MPRSARLSLSEARAHLRLATGDLDAAAHALNENRLYHRDEQIFVTVLENLAYHVALDRLAEAERNAREVIRMLAPREHRHGLILGSIEVLALIDAIGGDARRAAILSAHVDAGFASMCYERIGSPRTVYDRLTARLRENLLEDERARLSAEGKALSPEAALELVLKQAP